MIKMIAVLDQIIGENYAVLLIGEEEADFLVPIKKLPPDVKEGDLFFIALSNEGVLLSVILIEEHEVLPMLCSEDGLPHFVKELNH
ncbi:DUF3006 family protein [Niallia taxi]|uniref:DUF3006 family protein n=1 Tax=Niallia taxi TaxID=2499688 RepID=UPI0015F454C1|nr:DUF3006 family protein [Niallia taxi]